MTGPRKPSVLGAAASFLLTACASGGSVSSPPVPVYFSVDDVPCAYEVLGTVRREVHTTGASAWERAGRRVLGRAGVTDLAGELARMEAERR